MPESQSYDPAVYREAGERTVNSWGGSLAITLPPEALDLAGADIGTTFEVEARDGEIRLTRIDPTD